MNKKLRIFLCSIVSVLMIFTVAFAGCDENPSDTSDSTSVSDSTGTESTGSEESSSTHTHTYDYTNYELEWADDMSSATVTVPCTDSTCGESLSVTATVTSEVTTAATKLSAGVTTYTAAFTLNGTDYTKSVEVATPATATVYDAYYIDELEETGTVAEGTSLFDGFATTAGKVFWYNTASVTPETDNIVDGYTFQGYLTTSALTPTGTLTFTLANDAVVTIYAKASFNDSSKGAIYSGTDTSATPAGYLKAGSDTAASSVLPYEFDLDAGTYTIAFNSSNTVIYAIMLEGTGYTAGLVGGTYTPATPVETTTTLVLDETVYVAEYSTVTFTATDAGWYTFTLSETKGYGQLYASSEDSDALLDENSEESGSAYTKELGAGESISFYVENGGDGTFAITTTYSATDPDAVEYTAMSFASEADVASGWAYWNDQWWCGSSVTVNEAKYVENDDGTYTVVYSISSAENSSCTFGYQLFYNDTTNYTVGNTYTLTATITSDIDTTVTFNGTSYTLTAGVAQAISVEFTYTFDNTGNNMSLFDFQQAISGAITANVTISNIKWTAASTSELSFGANTINLTADEANDGVDYTYTVAADGYYTFTVACTDGSTTDLDAYIKVYYSGSSNQDLILGLSYYSSDEANSSGIYLTADTVVTFNCASNSYPGVATTYVITIANFKADGDKDDLMVGTNAIELTADEASGYEVSFTATSTGIYTFSVESGSDTYIYVAGKTIYSSSYGDNLSIALYLKEGDEVEIEFRTYSGNEGSYNFIIEKTDTSDADVATLIADTGVTATAYLGVDGYTTYVFATYTTTETSGYVNVALTFSTSYITGATVTVNGTTVSVENYHFNIDLSDGAGTYSIVITCTWSYMYTVPTHTATLSAGQYIAVTTSVNDDEDTYTLKADDNAIALSATDGKSGITATFTPTEDGLYSFTVLSTETASVTIGGTSIKSNGTTTASFYLTAGTALSVTLKTTNSGEGKYTLTVASATGTAVTLTEGTTATLTRYTNGLTSSTGDTTQLNYAYVTFTTAASSDETVNYYITLSSSSTSWTSYLSSITLTLNGTKYSHTNYNFNLTGLAPETTYTALIYLGGYLSTYTYVYATITAGTYTPYTTSINADSTDNADKIVTGTNAIVLSNDDAADGYVYSSLTLAAGAYTFEVASTEDGDVYVATSEDNYTAGTYINVNKNNTSTLLILDEETTIYIVLMSYSGNEAKYSLTISSTTLETAALKVGEDVEFTIYNIGTNTYIAYMSVTTDDSTAGAYNIALTDTDDDIIYGYATVTVAINGVEATVEGGVFNITLEASKTYSIVATFVCGYFDLDKYEYYATLSSGAATLSSVPDTLSTDEDGNTVTLTDTGASNGITTYYTLAAGTWTISVNSEEDGKVTIYDDTYTVYGSIGYSWRNPSYSYEFELEAATVIYITYSTYDYYADTYTVYVSYTAPATTVTGVDATVNIGSLVSAGTLTATDYTADVTLYTGRTAQQLL